MRLISNWAAKKLTCQMCGTTKSVKYVEDKTSTTVCNSCVLIIENDDS